MEMGFILLDKTNAMIHDFGRSTRTPFFLLKDKKDHKDLQIKKIQPFHLYLKQ